MNREGISDSESTGSLFFSRYGFVGWADLSDMIGRTSKVARTSSRHEHKHSLENGEWRTENGEG